MAENTSKRGRRGFASMDMEKRREIARKGGKAAHEKGTAHEFSSQEARQAGQKGGTIASQDREHMAEIGRKGGLAWSRHRRQLAGHNDAGSGRENGDSEENLPDREAMDRG